MTSRMFTPVPLSLLDGRSDNIVSKYELYNKNIIETSNDKHTTDYKQLTQIMANQCTKFEVNKVGKGPY